MKALRIGIGHVIFLAGLGAALYGAEAAEAVTTAAGFAGAVVGYVVAHYEDTSD